MGKFTNPLDNIRIASPCSADWNGMYGDERKRFCGDCKLNVYNLSGMTKADAEALVMNAEGRLCVRYYLRPDGSVITQDCPVGWAGIKHRTRLFATAAASMLMAIVTGVFFVSLLSNKKAGPNNGRVLMGAIAVNSNRKVEEPPRYVMGNVAPQKKKMPIAEIKAPVVERSL